MHTAGEAEAPRRVSRGSGWLWFGAVAVGIFALGTTAYVARRSSSAQPTAVEEAGPGNTKTRYQAGQGVDVYYAATWYPGRVLQVQGDRYEISYDGWSATWNEWVTASRLRARTEARMVETPDSVASATAVPGSYSVGDQVQIEWRGSWYPGAILEARGDRYKITYEGYSSSWDEWVKISRLRRP